LVLPLETADVSAVAFLSEAVLFRSGDFEVGVLLLLAATLVVVVGALSGVSRSDEERESAAADLLEGIEDARFSLLMTRRLSVDRRDSCFSSEPSLEELEETSTRAERCRRGAFLVVAALDLLLVVVIVLVEGLAASDASILRLAAVEVEDEDTFDSFSLSVA
jgi:hypothetical protein